MVWRIGEALVQPTHASNVSEDALAKPWYNLRASNVIGEWRIGEVLVEPTCL